MTNKLCINCKHFQLDTFNWTLPEHQVKYAICSRTSTVTFLMGEECRAERDAGLFPLGRCGVKAKYFEPKEPKP